MFSQFKEVKVTDEMIGHKLGQFSYTRKPFSFRSVPPFSFDNSHAGYEIELRRVLT
jgi:hypothetical protein